MGQRRYLIRGHNALVFIAEVAADVVHHGGHLGVAQVSGPGFQHLAVGQTECRHPIFAVEHGQRRVLPRDQRRIAGQFGIMAGADGALSLGHVAALTNMRVDIRAAGVADAGVRGECRIIGVRTRGDPGGQQQRRESARHEESGGQRDARE